MSSASPDAILHLTTLHLLSQAGFASTSQAASFTLSTAASKYIGLVARSCVEKALLAGRSKPCAADVLSSLGEVGEDVDTLWEYLAGPISGDRGDEEGVGGGLRWRGGMDGLDSWLAAGRAPEGTIAEMRLVPNDQIPPEEDGDSVESEGDDPMDVDEDDYALRGLGKGEAKDHDPMTWLPPLPGHTPPPVVAPLPVVDLASPTAPAVAAAAAPPLASSAPLAPPRTICDRYRHPLPFSSSQLSAREWVDPLPPREPRPPRPSTSSFPSLLEAYKATASEPSVTMVQSDLRRQATELLRRSIAPADKWMPKDTLSFDIPGPRVSPFVASYPEDDKSPHQPHLIPINPNPTGLLASLVHQIHSPHLPDALRIRLTGLRAPLPQKDNAGHPIFYGPKVRAPDAAAREKWKGKQVDPSDETYLRYTWDSGPRGAEKYSSARLPSGKKVIASGEGEDVPRVPAGANKLRIKIERSNSVVSPSAGTGAAMAGWNEAGPSGTSGGSAIVDSPAAISPAPTPTPTSAGGGPGQTIKISLNPKRASISPMPSATSPAAINGSPFTSEGISPKTISAPRQATPPAIPSAPLPAANGHNAGPSGTGRPALKIRLSTSGASAPRPT